MQIHVVAMWPWYPFALFLCDLNSSISRDYLSIMGKGPSVMCPLHLNPFAALSLLAD